MKQGDVCLVSFPFTDGSSKKFRPVLVVSADEFNAGEDVVVVPLSSAPKASDPYSIFISEASAEFQSSGLKKPSAIKWAKVMTISRSLLKRRLGQVPQEVLAEVSQSIGQLVAVQDQ